MPEHPHRGFRLVAVLLTLGLTAALSGALGCGDSDPDDPAPPGPSDGGDSGSSDAPDLGPPTPDGAASADTGGAPSDAAPPTDVGPRADVSPAPDGSPGDDAGPACPADCGPDAVCGDGDGCIEDPCASLDCGVQGRCTDGRCLCEPGWAGRRCGQPRIDLSPGPYGLGVRETAEPFVLPTLDGSFDLQERWSGASAYIFVVLYPGDPQSATTWASPPEPLLRGAPEDLHVVFGSYGRGFAQEVQAQRDRFDAALAGMDPELQRSWEGRLHFVTERVNAWPGSIGEFISAQPRTFFAVDRLQRWREVGLMLDWLAYLQDRPASEFYPLESLVYEAQGFDYEAALHARLQALAGVPNTRVVLFDGERHPGGWGAGHSSHWEIDLPDAASLQAYDSLGLYLYQACPGHLQGVENGCNEWDYIQHLFLCDAPVDPAAVPPDGPCAPAVAAVPEVVGSCKDAGVDCRAHEDCPDPEDRCLGYEPEQPARPAETRACSCAAPWGVQRDGQHTCGGDGLEFSACECPCDTELARWVTPYAREGEWLSDLSPLLPLLQAGGHRRLRFVGANGYDLWGTLLFWDSGAADRPIAAQPLWGRATGTRFDEHYNDGRHAHVAFTLPEGATRAAVVATISGHGSGSTEENCAEFCDHTHEFRVNERRYLRSHPEASTWFGCRDLIPAGVVPNQFGTWVFGRGGWCPGWHIEPWSVDVTRALLPEGNSLQYRGLYLGRDYRANYTGQGDYLPEIKLSSWLVSYGPRR